MALIGAKIKPCTHHFGAICLNLPYQKDIYLSQLILLLFISISIQMMRGYYGTSTTDQLQKTV